MSLRDSPDLFRGFVGWFCHARELEREAGDEVRRGRKEGERGCGQGGQVSARENWQAIEFIFSHFLWIVYMAKTQNEILAISCVKIMLVRVRDQVTKRQFKSIY